jgi:hypothetical protein
MIMGLGLRIGLGLGFSTPSAGGGGGDVTAPTLSSPVGTQTGSTTATIGATTNEGNGTMYGVVSTSSTAPTATQVKAGQMHTGAAAAFAGSTSVASTGAKTISATGLTASTAYFAHLMHEDASGNKSSVSTSAQFTTAAGLSGMTWSASDKTSNITLTGSSLTATENSGAGNFGTARSSRQLGFNKTYWEVTPDAGTVEIGVCDGGVAFPTPNGGSDDYWGSASFGQVATSHAVGWQGNDNQLYYNDGFTTIGSFAASDRIGIAFDKTAEKIWVRKNNGSWLPSGDPAAGTGGLAVTGLDADVYPFVQPGPVKSATANFGTTPGGTAGFTDTPPTGFVAP